MISKYAQIDDTCMLGKQEKRVNTLSTCFLGFHHYCNQGEIFKYLKYMHKGKHTHFKSLE